MTGDGSGPPPPPGDPSVQLRPTSGSNGCTPRTWPRRHRAGPVGPAVRPPAGPSHPPAPRPSTEGSTWPCSTPVTRRWARSHDSAAAETEQVREVAVAARGQARGGHRAGRPGCGRGHLGSEKSSARWRTPRPPSIVEPRISKCASMSAVALNDELSLAVDALRSDVQTSRPGYRSSQDHLEELERIKGSLVASTEELFRTTITLAQEVADIRGEVVAKAGGRADGVHLPGSHCRRPS